jgi:hypothetical protein
VTDSLVCSSNCSSPLVRARYDFWDGVHSSAEANNTYSTDLFTERATQLIEKHDASEPFFLYLAWQVWLCVTVCACVCV